MTYCKHLVLLLFLVTTIIFSACGNEDVNKQLVCEKIPVGCCYGETLVYCDTQGEVLALDCSGKCLWIEQSEYNADDSALETDQSVYSCFASVDEKGTYLEDPSGFYPRECEDYVREYVNLPDGDVELETEAEAEEEAVIDGDAELEAEAEAEEEAVIDGDAELEAETEAEEEAVIDGDAELEAEEEAVIDGDAELEAEAEEEAYVDGDDELEAEAEVEAEVEVEIEEESSDNFVVLDPATNLEWEGNPPTEDIRYTAAVSYCQNLDLEGGDWRVPNIDELRSLIRGCSSLETGGACPFTTECFAKTCMADSCFPEDCVDEGGPNGCYILNTLAGKCFAYWTSTDVTGTFADDILLVDFLDGNIFYSSKMFYLPVRCVRDKQNPVDGDEELEAEIEDEIVVDGDDELEAEVEDELEVEAEEEFDYTLSDLSCESMIGSYCCYDNSIVTCVDGFMPMWDIIECGASGCGWTGTTNDCGGSGEDPSGTYPSNCYYYIDNNLK